MASVRARHRAMGSDYWPGFVDMLSTLLLVVIFLLSLFMLTNYFVTTQSSGKDTLLSQLNTQLAQLTELLALERSKKQSLEDSLASLQATLSDQQAENARLSALLEQQGTQTDTAETRASSLSRELAEQKGITNDALAKVEVLNQQLAALRRQLAALQDALDAAEEKDRKSQVKIADLGKRLNLALARKVQELARYRSDFFGRLREILGNREDIRVVGDRFVFQSEVLFDSGSAELKPNAEPELDKLAGALKQLETEIPDDIPWVLRVDGHTDINPIATADFASNWELSSERAIAVVKYLIRDGVPPNRLVAAGFGEYAPLDTANTTEAYRKNRRIELKLTEK
ncbi:putative lipoprotein YiaD precursor [Methyloligella halotolerans]|uniref:Putative lipoprotein YiaD n=1 Tax=Methyloligella halotolerans TaxID=1177755 RepID=A0A1E2RZG4_9HYPH|nr:peptidoglycan -binding protein [Methyloligella halotolerans]ODA67550.1 putative lipoprotein YiaD precursor [Methyloligella halotolerans]